MPPVPGSLKFAKYIQQWQAYIRVSAVAAALLVGALPASLDYWLRFQDDSASETKPFETFIQFASDADAQSVDDLTVTYKYGQGWLHDTIDVTVSATLEGPTPHILPTVYVPKGARTAKNFPSEVRLDVPPGHMAPYQVRGSASGPSLIRSLYQNLHLVRIVNVNSDGKHEQRLLVAAFSVPASHYGHRTGLASRQVSLRWSPALGYIPPQFSGPSTVSIQVCRICLVRTVPASLQTVDKVILSTPRYERNDASTVTFQNRRVFYFVLTPSRLLVGAVVIAALTSIASEAFRKSLVNLFAGSSGTNAGNYARQETNREIALKRRRSARPNVKKSNDARRVANQKRKRDEARSAEKRRRRQLRK